MIENHPFEPWLPKNAHLLMLGTFPPSPKRWCIPWYYPNFQNDMWRIFGIIFFGDKLHFVDVEHKQYRLEAIKEFLGEKGVALFDTAQKVIRTKNTASDKDLKIVELSDLDGMLRALPECKAVLTWNYASSACVIPSLLRSFLIFSAIILYMCALFPIAPSSFLTYRIISEIIMGFRKL